MYVLCVLFCLDMQLAQRASSLLVAGAEARGSSVCVCACVGLLSVNIHRKHLVAVAEEAACSQRVALQQRFNTLLHLPFGGAQQALTQRIRRLYEGRVCREGLLSSE